MRFLFSSPESAGNRPGIFFDRDGVIDFHGEVPLVEVVPLHRVDVPVDKRGIEGNARFETEIFREFVLRNLAGSLERHDFHACGLAFVYLYDDVDKRPVLQQFEPFECHLRVQEPVRPVERFESGRVAAKRLPVEPRSTENREERRLRGFHLPFEILVRK